MKKAASITCLICIFLLLVSCTPSDGHRHTLERVAANAATCTEAGNHAYYVCTTCHKAFSDANGTKETTAEEQTVPATGHLLPPTGMCGLVQCENCGGMFGRTDHELNDATCTTCISCKHCGYTDGDPLGHLWETECDTTCGRCGETRTASHADTDHNDVCDYCGDPISATIPGDGGSTELPKDEF